MPRRGKLQNPSPYCPEERKERDRRGFAKLFGQSQQGKRARPPRQTSGSRSRLALPRPRPAPGDNSGGNSDGGGVGGGSTSIHGRVPSASAAPASGGLDSGSASSVPSPDTHGEEEEEEEDIYTYDDDDPATGPIRSGGEPQAPGYDEEGALRKAMDESRREDEQREASKKGQGDDSPRQEVGSLSSHGSGHTATPRGLSNPGRLCYFNALVQAVSSPSSTLGCTLLELAKLPAERRNALPATFKMADIARKVNSPSPAPTTPLSIEDAVRELLGREFDSARQHCVYDAFGALAKRIDEESTRAGLQPSPLLASIAVECQTTARCMNGFCSTNGLERDVGQPATDFSLDVSFDDGCNTPTTLKALLHKLLESDTVENNSCPGCDAVITDQRVVYTQLPPTLVIAVKRAMKDGSKNTRRLDFALTGTQFGGSNYDVRGIIVHEGERATSGHYKALVKAGGGAGGWFCADDRTVTEVPESDVLAQEASMFVLQREGTNAERASSAAVGAFLLGMAPSGAAMQGVDAGGVAAGDARASGSAGVNANGDGGGDSSSSGGGSSSGSVYKTVSDSDRSDGGGVVNDGNGSIGGGSVDSSGGGGDNTDGDSDGMDGDSSGKRRKSCDGGRKKEHGGGCREDSSGNSSTGGATSKASSGGSSSSSNGAEKCGTAAAAALPKRRRVDGGSAGGAAKRKKSGGGSGNTTGEEPTSGDDDDDSSGSGSGSKSRSMSRSRGRSRSSSSGGSGSGSGGGGGGGGALSPAQAAAMESLKRDEAWFLRIEDREVSPAERQKARRLLENPRELHGLRNEALENPQVYRGTRSWEDLDRHQLRDLVGAALLPENGLSRILGFFKGDLLALESACDEAELQGPVGFSKFLRDRGVDAPVNPNHPAFAGDPAAWTHPILLKQGMCLQYQKRPFYHESPTTITGKASAAANKVSSFEGGPAGHGNRLGGSCVKVVADRPEPSASAIPHCAALSQLRPELRQVAGVVERSFARSFLCHFTATPGVGVFRGGDITQAGRGRDTVRELASVGGRKAFVYWGRHQSRAIGDPAALESAARGDLELCRACTNGEEVTDARVGGMMVDILMEAIEIHAEANGGEPTDNDTRRSDELEEARDQGLPHILEVTGRVGKELRGKHVRTRADCIAGATADLRPETIAHPAHQRTVAKGKTPSRSNVNKTAEERGSTKSTNEGKADGGRIGGNASWTGSSKGLSEEETRAALVEAEKARAAAPEEEMEKADQVVAAATKRVQLAKTAKKRRSDGGANGDRQKKVVGGGQSSGNRCGSKVPFASRLQEVPGVALLCDGCGHDWCGLPRGRGVARGYVDKDNAVVTVVQEKHWKCKKRCKPAAGAKVRIDGVEYTVKSAQDGQFRRGSV